MDNNALIDIYRKKLTNLHALIVVVVIILEIAAYALFIKTGKVSFEISSPYLWRGVIIPIALNIICHITARYICVRTDIDDAIKNAVIVYATMLTAIVVSVFHREYVITSCTFVFPLLLCTMFNDKRLLTQSFIISVAGIAVTVMLTIKDINPHLDVFVNYLVLLGFLMVSYLSGKVSIDNSELNQLVIENQARTNKRLRNKLNKDPMTELYNHKMFHKELANTVYEANEGDFDFCLAMFDIDDFKTINDTYGHDSGDDVLLALSRLIRKNCTNSEVPFRYGGEEFAIIFKGREIAASQGIIQTILSEFRNSKFIFSNESLSFSCGIAQYEKGMAKEEIFDLADDGMYFAKNNGKNQIYINSRHSSLTI